MKRLYEIVGALLVCGLLAVALPVSAQAVSPSSVQRKAYAILLNVSTRVLAVSDKTVSANATAVGNELASCIPTLQTASVPQSATEALGIEMGEQYVGAADRPVFKALITASEQAAKLPPVGPRVKLEFQSFATLATGTLALHTCADAATWQAASFAPGSEPAGTQLASGWLKTPIPNLGDTLSFLLTPGQRQAISPIYNRASKHVKHLLGLAENLGNAWLAQNGA